MSLMIYQTYPQDPRCPVLAIVINPENFLTIYGLTTVEYLAAHCQYARTCIAPVDPSVSSSNSSS